MRRVVFTGISPTDLADLADMSPGAAIKLMFPLKANGAADRTLGRAYTIRRYHAERAELEVDFVVHDETPTAHTRRQRVDGVHAHTARGGFERAKQLRHETLCAVEGEHSWAAEKRGDMAAQMSSRWR